MNILLISILFTLLPLLYVFGVPAAKLFPSLLLISIFIKLTLNSYTKKKFTYMNSLITVFILYHIVAIIQGYNTAISEGFFNYEIFVGSILSNALHSMLPILFYFGAIKLPFNKVKNSIIFNRLGYSILGLVIITSIYYASSKLNYTIRTEDLRNIPLLIKDYLPQEDTIQTRLSLSKLYLYFGRSNTLAPALTLSLCSMLPLIRLNLKRILEIRNFCYIIFSFISIISIFYLNSRASLLAIFLTILISELIILLIDNYNYSKLIIKYSLSFVIFIIGFYVINNIESLSIDSYIYGARFAIMNGLIKSGKLFTIFGNGIGSSSYLCQIDSTQYFDVYSTNFCTLHNYYLTLLHDFGIIGFSIFILIIFQFIYRIMLTINKTNLLKRTKFISNKKSINSIKTALYFIICSLILFIFDSDIMTYHPIFSSTFWMLLGYNFRYLYYEIKYINKQFEKNQIKRIEIY